MSLCKNGTTRLGLALGLAAVMAAGSIVPALAADNTVTQTITAGSLTSSIAELGLTAKNYSHVEQDSTGHMALTVDDNTGSGHGWNVTVESGAFVGSGAASGHDIANTAFSIGTPASLVSTAGQDTTGVTAGTGGSLDAPRTVNSATANHGMGTYTQDLPVTLAIPADAYAGSYTAALTVTANDGPAV